MPGRFKLTSALLLADMDGFKLLEQVGLELDLPVISTPYPCSAQVVSGFALYCRTTSMPQHNRCWRLQGGLPQPLAGPPRVAGCHPEEQL